MDTVGHIRTLVQTQILQRAIPIVQPWVMRHHGVALMDNAATVETVGLSSEDSIYVSLLSFFSPFLEQFAVFGWCLIAFRVKRGFQIVS